MAQNGEPAQKRWVRHNGQWRLFNVRPGDPMWEGSAEFVSGEPAPHRDVTAEDIAAGRSEPAPRPSARADAGDSPDDAGGSTVESYGKPTTNKARGTRSGSSRTGDKS